MWIFDRASKLRVTCRPRNSTGKEKRKRNRAQRFDRDVTEGDTRVQPRPCHMESHCGSQIAAQDVAVTYLETPSCLHTATRAVDSLFLSTLKEHSGKAKAGEVLCMRCGNIWHRTRGEITRRAALSSRYRARDEVRERNRIVAQQRGGRRLITRARVDRTTAASDKRPRGRPDGGRTQDEW